MPPTAGHQPSDFVNVSFDLARPDPAVAAVASDDGKLDLSDPITVLSSLFRGTGLLPAPGWDGAASFDPTPDQLFCDE